MITTTLAKIGDPIEADDSVASGIWYDLGGIIFLVILVIIAALVIRQVVRNANQERVTPAQPPVGASGDRTRLTDKLRNALGRATTKLADRRHLRD